MSRSAAGFWQRFVPTISETERAALAAGTVWADGELLSGAPRLARLLGEPWPELTAAERAFLDGPVEEACRRVDPWELAQTGELPPALWAYLGEQRFFGLGLPSTWGGHGFSALAQSTIFAKLATHSLALSAVVLIPNSVGPGELLLAHGTPEQQAHWLPRLVRGEEIPCFALTEPGAGSDAASLVSRGVVERGADGTPWLRLDFEKRYITLAPVATLVGLAVRLEDPDELLGRGHHPGITVVLVPASTPGVEIGARHDPLGVPFPNGPIVGRNVRLPAANILGGPAKAGEGWRMLMEALSAGRAISLPAQSAGGIKLMARMAGGYAAVREQFGLPIARFEGIAAPLARLAGFAYLVDAARIYTAAAVDRGERPAVISALLKYQSTELCRRAVADAMDVMGGAAICRGPHNRVADGWLGAPIGITVEGANILTRTLIVFGQALVRSHPHMPRLLAAVESGRTTAVAVAVGRQVGGFAVNLLRALLHELGLGSWTSRPEAHRLLRQLGSRPNPPAAARQVLRRAVRLLRRGAARFALLADLAALSLGPRLKRRGALTGRLADMLGALFLALAATRRFLAEGCRGEDVALLAWSLDHCGRELDRAAAELAANLPSSRLGRWTWRSLAAWWSLHPLATPASDRLDRALADRLVTPGADRDRLTSDLHLPADPTSAVGRIEAALEAVVATAPLRAALRRQPRDPATGATDRDPLAAAIGRGELSEQEATTLRTAERLRAAALAVDSFSREQA
jgi:acyl-CoA dehydrogenase